MNSAEQETEKGDDDDDDDDDDAYDTNTTKKCHNNSCHAIWLVAASSVGQMTYHQNSK